MPKEPLAKSSIEFLLGTIIALFLVVFPLTWWLKLIITFILAAIIIHLIDSSPLTIKWKRIIKTAVSFSIIFLLFATQSILIPEAKEIIMNIHKQFEGKPTWLVYGILCVIGSFLMCGYWGITGKIFSESMHNKNAATNEQAAPKLDIKLYVKPGIKQYPLQNYSLMVQNVNHKSATIKDLRIEFMFKNIVVQVKAQPISLDSAGMASMYETKNGRSYLVYEDQPEETALTKHFSLRTQKAIVNEQTINTNLVWFDCDVWPEKMTFSGDIIVDLSKTPEIHKRPEKESTYYGTYYYTANGQKVSETINGIIPDLANSELPVNPKEGAIVYWTDERWLEKNNTFIDFTPQIQKDGLGIHAYRDKDNVLKVQISNAFSKNVILKYADFNKLKKNPHHPKHMVAITWGNGEDKLYIDGQLVDEFPKH
jgi:hypothetical protein